MFLGSDGDGRLDVGQASGVKRDGASIPLLRATHYGLGKSGWVTVTFAPKDDVPMFLLEGWINESYRAVAPRKLAEKASAPTPARPKSARPKAAKKKRLTPAPARPQEGRGLERQAFLPSSGA